YRDGKSISSEMPCHALSFFRGLASVFCDMLDQDFDSDTNLGSKIKSLRDRGLINYRTESHLRALQKNGNIAAHPEHYQYEKNNFSNLAKQATDSSLHLIELAYILSNPNASLPEYEVSNTEANLKDLSY